MQRQATVMSVLLYLLSAVVVTHSQTIPYITFMGTNLSNHSYIDFTLVGDALDGSTSVQCYTNLDTCCSASQGSDCGDWYYPNGERLGFAHGTIGEFQSRQAKRVDLRHQGFIIRAQGVYRCGIAVSHMSGAETIYAGLYTTGGNVNIPDPVKFTINSDLNGESPQFTLTCISTGGPATNVTWTRDSETVSGGMTTLNNAVTAQYTHTLTVIGRQPGNYQCIVSNNKPSRTSGSFTVQVASAPTNLIVRQAGPTTLRVTWTVPTPLGDTTGYRIYFNGSSRDIDVSGDSCLLIDLQNGATYTISIVGISPHFFSEHVDYPNSIPLIPGVPNIVVSSATTNIIFLYWSVSNGSVVHRYEVLWERSNTRDCPDLNKGSAIINGDSNSYTILGLEEGRTYRVTVTATNAAGSAVSDPITETTVEAVPTAPPNVIKISNVTSSSISIQWKVVDCIHQNGEITGYSVKYEIQGSNNQQTANVSGGDTTEFVISKLISATSYRIKVAAVNNAGIGDHSIPITAVTNSNSSREREERGGNSVGGAVGGVVTALIMVTLVVAIVITGLWWWRKRAQERKHDLATSTNPAYSCVEQVKGTEPEMCSMPPGAAMATQEPEYETVSV